MTKELIPATNHKGFHLSAFRGRAFALALVAVSVMLCSLAAWAEPKKDKKTKVETPKEFVIVIDAGHGGHDHGAIDNGAREKDINLGVANKLASLIRKKLKNVKVVMTRSDDRFISLEERANIANRNKANLFVSIHTNSVDKSNPNRKSVAGASVYALGPQKDANNLKVAQRENSVIELEDNYHQKYSGFDPSKDESYIIFEMAQKKNLGQSLKFAKMAQQELVATGRKDRGVKQAGFWVLWATSMPSVLVELDFICNPDEAKFLDSEEGQEKLAKGLLKAVDQYVKSYRDPSVKYASNSADASIEEAAVAETVEEDYDGVSTLVAANSEKPVGQRRTDVAGDAGNNSRYYGGSLGSRKRRSDSSKKKSESRSYETETILLRSESDFLAQKEEVKEMTVKEEPVKETPDKNKKNKKDKKKKKSSKSDKQTAKSNDKKSAQSNDKQVVAAAAEQSIGTTRGGKKTIKVKTSSSGAIASAASTPATTRSSSPVLTNASGNPQTTYKILLLSSTEKLATNDPAFCGIVPTGQYYQNGKFNYTFGGSTDRREAEEQLLKIKSTLPGATIIVTTL